ncbi:hypothetical protein ACRN9Z_19315 [Shewanella frigidimarina]|uniref:hypothetical protein n=1 Tax=Shewanella TaxID=22 RepID=UPI000C42D148|nr:MULTISPECIES: hypothetical protein [Shewanella]NCQ47187.1 hypothetical protein [Shewanella frigidimarina]MBB1390075.1 hypothetical protein [Shewanella sp. SG44-6]NCP38823.1 hypothetical protein [Shewanella vesiculosa]NCP71747.1 hypothetical protein [Shewanella vesiculosa]NCQ40201.1 hypothetical protein [Shewanella vesiculosa]
MSIYVKREEDNQHITWIAKGEWELPSQILNLEKWLIENESKLPPSNYIADIGFSMRNNACGGGAILSVRAMAIMAKLGIKLYLSEYPDD